MRKEYDIMFCEKRSAVSNVVLIYFFTTNTPRIFSVSLSLKCMCFTLRVPTHIEKNKNAYFFINDFDIQMHFFFVIICLNYLIISIL